jgi:hypothetical protein
MLFVLEEKPPIDLKDQIAALGRHRAFAGPEACSPSHTDI